MCVEQRAENQPITKPTASNNHYGTLVSSNRTEMIKSESGEN